MEARRTVWRRIGDGRETLEVRCKPKGWRWRECRLLPIHVVRNGRRKEPLPFACLPDGEITSGVSVPGDDATLPAELFAPSIGASRIPRAARGARRGGVGGSAVEAEVMVVDLSGFSRMTRKHGILQFRTVYRRSCASRGPRSIDANGGRMVKCGGDTSWTVFPRHARAVATARALVPQTTRSERRSPGERSRRRVRGGRGRTLPREGRRHLGDRGQPASSSVEDVARRPARSPDGGRVMRS